MREEEETFFRRSRKGGKDKGRERVSWEPRGFFSGEVFREFWITGGREGEGNGGERGRDLTRLAVTHEWIETLTFGLKN